MTAVSCATRRSSRERSASPVSLGQETQRGYCATARSFKSRPHNPEAPYFQWQTIIDGVLSMQGEVFLGWLLRPSLVHIFGKWGDLRRQQGGDKLRKAATAGSCHIALKLGRIPRHHNAVHEQSQGVQAVP